MATRQSIYLDSMRWAATLLILVGVSLAALLLLSSEDLETQAFQLVNHYSEVLKDHFGCSGELPVDGEAVPLDLRRLRWSVFSERARARIAWWTCGSAASKRSILLTMRSRCVRGAGAQVVPDF